MDVSTTSTISAGRLAAMPLVPPRAAHQRSTGRSSTSRTMTRWRSDSGSRSSFAISSASGFAGAVSVAAGAPIWCRRSVAKASLTCRATSLPKAAEAGRSPPVSAVAIGCWGRGGGGAGRSPPVGGGVLGGGGGGGGGGGSLPPTCGRLRGRLSHRPIPAFRRFRLPGFGNPRPIRFAEKGLDLLLEPASAVVRHRRFDRLAARPGGLCGAGGLLPRWPACSPHHAPDLRHDPKDHEQDRQQPFEPVEAGGQQRGSDGRGERHHGHPAGSRSGSQSGHSAGRQRTVAEVAPPVAIVRRMSVSAWRFRSL